MSQGKNALVDPEVGMYLSGEPVEHKELRGKNPLFYGIVKFSGGLPLHPGHLDVAISLLLFPFGVCLCLALAWTVGRFRRSHFNLVLWAFRSSAARLV